MTISKQHTCVCMYTCVYIAHCTFFHHSVDSYTNTHTELFVWSSTHGCYTCCIEQWAVSIALRIYLFFVKIYIHKSNSSLQQDKLNTTNTSRVMYIHNEHIYTYTRTWSSHIQTRNKQEYAKKSSRYHIIIIRCFLSRFRLESTFSTHKHTHEAGVTFESNLHTTKTNRHIQHVLSRARHIHAQVWISL